MGEIPSGLMERAERTLDQVLCECTESCGGTEGLRRQSIETIARALAGERERVLAYIEDAASEHEAQGNVGWHPNVAMRIRHILAEIRAQP